MSLRPPRDWVQLVLVVTCTYIAGLLSRLGRTPDLWLSAGFSLAIDSVVLLLLVPLLALQRWAWATLPVWACAAAISISLAVAVSLVLLAALAITTVIPGMVAPYGGVPRVQASYYAIVFLAWSAAAAWARGKQGDAERKLRTVMAERMAADAEMRRLRMQLDSHFMFNALNTIAVEIQDDPRQALMLVRELSQYLRFCFDTADHVLVPIAAEVAALRSYLRVQTRRFGSQLEFKVKQAGSTRGWLVPAFLVQPLVENATKYGIPNEAGVLTVTVAIRSEGQSLFIHVTNTGDLLRSGERGGTGMGLIALTRRLELHYPGRHHFALLQDGDAVRAEMRLEGQAC